MIYFQIFTTFGYKCLKNSEKNSGFKAVFGDENNKDVIVGVPVQEHRRDGG